MDFTGLGPSLDSIWGWLVTAWLWVAANSGPLGLVVAAVSAFIALRALRNTAKDSDSRSRPMVVAEFQFGISSAAHLDLVVRNYGPSLAKNLSVRFDRDITDGSGDALTIGHLVRNRYEGRTFHSFSPGQEFRNVWWRGEEVKGQRRMKNAFDTPDSVTVILKYADLKGKKYREVFELETDSFMQHTEGTSSASLLGRVKTINDSLSSLADSSKRMASAVEELDTLWDERRAAAGRDQADLLRRLGYNEDPQSGSRAPI
ncbi:hypothetical protein [Arthrobacter sp. NPDC057259]|uniref:hypothetical protein n=1 Tax=Arthrobacter sp. NPDC057259 TaxID=3346073 RepID=UPI00362A2FDB